MNAVATLGSSVASRRSAAMYSGVSGDGGSGGPSTPGIARSWPTAMFQGVSNVDDKAAK